MKLVRLEGSTTISWHFERNPIPYALKTDWPVEAAGFEPLHLRSLSLGTGLDRIAVREPHF
jgi:hypothetical protein